MTDKIIQIDDSLLGNHLKISEGAFLIAFVLMLMILTLVSLWTIFNLTPQAKEGSITPSYTTSEPLFS